MLGTRPKTLPSGFSERMRVSKPTRPVSVATEILDTDWEDGEDDNSEAESSSSEFEEEYAAKRSFDSDDSRRRSQTTLSSLDEAPTPEPNRESRQFDFRAKPVEGPRGPHLFRSSSSSAELAYDHALQMSPLIPIKLDLEPRQQRDSRQTRASRSQQPRPDPALRAAINQEEDSHSIIRRWTPAQVTDWMTSWNISPTVVRCFEKHDINGAVLLDLQFDDLRDLDIESFGKRHELWNAISVLRGDEEVTAQQEASRPSTRNTVSRSASRRDNSARSSTDDASALRTSPEGDHKKRRGRKGSKTYDTICPAESVSIVAIEQLLPKPHSCSKGQDCSKWQKQQLQIRQLQEGNKLGRFPASPTKKYRVPSSPCLTQPSTLQIPNQRIRSEIPTPRTALPPGEQDYLRPASEMVPSVVASSDLLGQSQYPAFALDPTMLEKLEKRDPQDNVRNFLRFQHLNSPANVPPTPPADLADGHFVSRSQSVPPVPQMFPIYHHDAYPSLRPATGANPVQDERLRGLPRLEIPRAATAPSTDRRGPNTASSPLGTAICRTTTASPTQIYRLGTPASAMDVPVTAIPIGPVARDTSQSVPPDMQYRQQTQSPHSAMSHRHMSHDWRRPSLPAVREGEVLSPLNKMKPAVGRPAASKNSSIDSSSSTWSSPEKKLTVSDPGHSSPVTRQFGYGMDCAHAGWMKKRRTKILRHEWQDAHFRLMGTQLNMHNSARLSASLKDSINVDDYAVACSTAPTNSKLTAAMRAFHIKNNDEKAAGAGGKEADPTAFAFQLVPNRDNSGTKKFTHPSLGKTHHFAVKNKDERIDWMREIMLAKALQQRGKGYDVEINGVQA